MRTTTDTLARKQFRWNSEYRETGTGLVAPSRVLRNKTVDLHPTRTPRALLEELNPGVDVDAALEQAAAG